MAMRFTLAFAKNIYSDDIGQVVFTKFLIVDNDSATGVRKGGFGSTSI